MTSRTASAGERTRSSGSAFLFIAAGLSGLAGYGVLLLAARALSKADNAQFLVFWGALFMVFGLLTGVTTETTRAVHASRREAAGGPPMARGSGLRVLTVGVLFGGVVALVTVLSGLLWAPALLGSSWPNMLAAVATGIALFSVHVTAAGVIAGQNSWRRFSLVICAEPCVRFVLCAAFVAAGAGILGLSWAAALPTGTLAVLILLLPGYRRVVRVRVNLTVAGFLRRIVTACAASGASAILLVGYPVLLRATTPPDVFASAAPIVLAVSLCRAPLLVPLGAYQNVVVTQVATRGLRALIPVVAGLAGLTVAGALAAWPLGPALLHVVNPSYDVASPVFSALVLSAGMVALLTVTGAATVGLDRHNVYLAGWIAATISALGPLLAPWGLEERVVGSLLVGPAVGVAVHLLCGSRRRG